MGDVANDIIEGFSCSWCGVYFEEPHGFPVVCKSCAKDAEPEDEAPPTATKQEL